MKRTGVLLAAFLVLVADAVVLMKVAQNRSGDPLATMELTERELQLVRPQRESTALFLELQWQPAWLAFKYEDGPGWFDRAKLEELGYDCSLPVSDPAAPSHYRAMRAKPMFAVLEYRQDTVGKAGEELSSRLWAVDAGRDPAGLRGRYPDSRRFLIVPSLIRLRYETPREPITRREAPSGYLRGVVLQTLVTQISVPPSQHQVLASLGSSTSEYSAGSEARALGPRYAVVLNYGKNYEPWIASCRRITATR